MEGRQVYLGRCRSRARFEPWPRLGALRPTTRPTLVMQLPCIKPRLACNLQAENTAGTLVGLTLQQFDPFIFNLSAPKL